MANSYGIGNTYMGADYKDYLNDQRLRKTQLGKNDFLNLLAAQMQYQNPLEPMSDTDFIAQLAQFSALEQMEAMSTAMIAMQAYNMVGKLVSASNIMCDDGISRNIDGYVQFVVQREGSYWAKVGDYLVPVSRITDIFDKQSISPDNPLVGAAHLIGSTVKAYVVETVDGQEKVVFDDNGDPQYKSGIVTGLAVIDNVVKAYIKGADGTEFTVSVNHIFDIRQSASSPATVPPSEEYAFVRTDRPLDFAISGKGYFVIETPHETMYTKFGNFFINDEDYLVDPAGHYVKGYRENPADPGAPLYEAGGTPPAGLDRLLLSYENDDGVINRYMEIYVDSYGKIVGKKDNGDIEVIGYMAVATFGNSGGLHKLDDNNYIASGDSGDANIHLPNSMETGSGQIYSGLLEMLVTPEK
ncbi:MAG: hypothetical protein FWG06_01520 [Clostridiales bacterium]|nr:hypothetical protein [Clostridiales bacterium]